MAFASQGNHHQHSVFMEIRVKKQFKSREMMFIKNGKIESLALLSFLLCCGTAGAASTSWQSDSSKEDAGTTALYTFELSRFDSQAPNTVEKSGYPALTFAPDGIVVGVDGKFGNGFLVEEPSEGFDLARFGYAQISRLDKADLFPSENLSVEIWYRPLSGKPAAGAAYSFMVDNQYSSKGGFCLYLFGKDQSLRVRIGNGTEFLQAISDPLDWDSEEWYRLRFSYDSTTGRLDLYRNDELVGFAMSPGFGLIEPYDGNLRIGNRLGSSYSPLPGYYDNFRITSTTEL